MIDKLLSLISSTRDCSYVEARYQSRIMTEVSFVNGELERIRVVENAGCGIRVLAEGCWGFGSTNDMSSGALKESLIQAMSGARVLALKKKIRIKGLANSKMAKGNFRLPARGNLSDIDIEQKIKVAREAEKAARRHSPAIKSASSTYREILDHKVLVNSDGAEVEIHDSKPEFGVVAIAKKSGESATAHEGIGITGGWDDLFGTKTHLEYAGMAAERATKLVEAEHPKGEKTTIILDPGMVGLLSHEAIGHTVEADFVMSGSVAKGKLGTQVASELVTLVDSGTSDFAENAAGTMIVDDEGVMAGRTAIIEKGILKSYLHNRESAMLFDTEPTGNARAFLYNDEPLIRMRNTFIEPRSDRLDDIIKETRHGYLVKGARNGQADANGEFMFGAEEALLIEHGEIKGLRRGASISGNAFEVLRSVDMVGDHFQYDIGTGYCGKYQPAKVDGGGPHVRCTAVIGGLQ
ncbi:MAG: TldD/PmbA family protein [Nitrososphaera sp.]